MVASVLSYIPRLDEIARTDYTPSVEDVLLSRVRTAGITEERFDINGREFVIIDVGGQKNERRKWIHCFDNVKAIVFVVALSEFDEVLFEDNSINRMLDSLTLFSSVCKNPHLKGISIILFLNKSDLFREKIARVNLCDVPQWTDYSGAPHSFDEGVDYFINKFIGTNRDRHRDIFYQVTCATDTSNIRFVWNACTEILLKEDLDKLGFVG
ncbi:GNAT3 [Symbiodinium microadriaticum]|nr:GNAT3 [Symbiodinium microadriaticum]